ncbi:hypothetical protein MWH28_11135 [Natroniella sulfidigena]|uniref:hypothetical protein n=1 Tax=Natroniella sulfidigena TaxID=723921 RepID=UPI00200A3568|nr:hypothetical protein [Natroniella sulfidigena]MCK8817918.1 hypothetical protein [Natroniella sulfidigena]
MTELPLLSIGLVATVFVYAISTWILSFSHAKNLLETEEKSLLPEVSTSYETIEEEYLQYPIEESINRKRAMEGY